MSSESVLKGAGAAQPLATRSTRTAASTFEPFIPASARLRELTAPPLIVGTLLGIIFGASSLYLVLKVGLTVSASIPVAVISITLFRALSRLGFRDATILENNIVQTAGSAERLLGAQAGSDVNSYKVVHKTTTEFEPAGRYLVNDQGAPVYLADPGINGVYTTVPGSGQTVTKFSAPKATLMSYIIKGVLGGDLPWALILLGTMIAITLELAGTSSLAFAVGMYLPISTSTPILLGGVVRWGVDRYLRTKPENQGLSEDEMTARTDQSQGVLLASGYIAGATLAGVVYSFLNLSESVTRRLVGFERWATEHNRAFDGPNADVIGLVPILVVSIFLYLVGRDWFLRKRAPSL